MSASIPHARRTDPTVHCWARPLHGGYVNAVGTTPEHLARVFAAERERLAALAKPRRRRAARPAPPISHPAQLSLVA
ncbi:hypothetical protein [Delftia sp. ASV31]|uniref:hypothetical protein n=1 Tax=Delftia sp. ASV31 TaxID=2795113 RepID=UPI0018EDD714|nr:hypothetical protein [Delftia sp. ASV31]